MAETNASETLKAVCDEAYEKNPKSCSHAVWAVIRGIVNGSEVYRQANELIDHLGKEWKEVTLDEAHELANKGIVVVGGAKADTNGHVIIVYPGEKKDTGGYETFNKKLNKTVTVGKRKMKYPLCMSTSIGVWPGAKSKGDKTVWDPWGNDTTFAKVKFWTPKS